MDAKRFAERVRNRTGVSDHQDEDLFCPYNFGTNQGTSNKYGLIITWLLPDIISCGRVVSLVLSWIVINTIQAPFLSERSQSGVSTDW